MSLELSRIKRSEKERRAHGVDQKGTTIEIEGKTRSVVC